MKDLINVLHSIRDNNHYLSITSDKLEDYRNGFVESITPLLGKLTIKERNILLNDKLFFNRLFMEKKYIQFACETTIVSYFAKKYPENFKYEVKLNKNNNKDVDCQFLHNNYIYNIEVKCPTFDAQEKQQLDNNFLFQTPIKMDKGFTSMLIDALNSVTQAEGLPKYVMPKYMENNLKDYLLSSNEKFKEATGSKSVNILFVCCSDARSMQQFIHHIFLDGGFFNEKPDLLIANPSQYENVDLIVLCNLYHKHSKYFNKPHLSKHWDLEDSFILKFDNPHSSHLSEKQEGISNFLYGILPDFTPDFIRFTNEAVWEGEELSMQVREAISLERYVSYLRPNGYNFF